MLNSKIQNNLCVPACLACVHALKALFLKFKNCVTQKGLFGFQARLDETAQTVAAVLKEDVSNPFAGKKCCQ